MMKKFLALLATAALTLSLAACGSTPAKEGSEASAKSDGASYTVGICQLVQHDALDAATQGFKACLLSTSPGPGDNRHWRMRGGG